MTRSVGALDRSLRAFLVAPVAIVFAVLVGAGMLIARALASKLHARLLAECERMFERMPDTFPPKRMMHGIDEIRATSARMHALLAAREQASEMEALGEEPPTNHSQKPVDRQDARELAGVGARIREHDLPADA